MMIDLKAEFTRRDFRNRRECLGVREISRLVSRVRYRQFGVLADSPAMGSVVPWPRRAIPFRYEAPASADACGATLRHSFRAGDHWIRLLGARWFRIFIQGVNASASSLRPFERRHSFSWSPCPATRCPRGWPLAKQQRFDCESLQAPSAPSGLLGSRA